ncbi:MAG: DUF4390 domain-containing protein [Magnetococcales bacterium]|nr:DUF4390 domain-containing protein [Magnetococcales bacterium]
MVEKSSLHKGFTAQLLLFLLLITTTGCSNNQHQQSANPLDKAAAFVRGGDLYARASLKHEFSKKIIDTLLHGEPIQASYHFTFFRNQNYLPDLPLAKVSIIRRIRLHLITRKYEMHDLTTNKINYTPDSEEAIRFLGNPKFVLLGKNANLKSESNYWLNVKFEIDSHGMSPVFRTLKRLLTLNQATDYQLSVDYIKP